jgi:hypothetical protein
MTIFDDDMDKKFKAADALIKDLFEFDKSTYKDEEAGSPKLSIIVPDGKIE